MNSLQVKHYICATILTMIYKHPALLYGLLFLIIPIIVHLFQLRRFTRVDFTNVAFLKPLISQSRKSRTIKKWLTLLSRLAAVACIVFAFSQPFIPNSTHSNKHKETVIYLDNSYSMQATGNQGVLYDNAVNDLVENLPSDQQISVFTNHKSYPRIFKQDIPNLLFNAGYSAQQLDYDQVQLKAQSLFKDKTARKELIFISDFQKKPKPLPDSLSGVERTLVQLLPEDVKNIAIDTAFIASYNTSNIELQVSISSNYQTSAPITISLYNADILVAKTSATLTDQKATAAFDLPSTTQLDGSIKIEDQGLEFDNQLFVSIHTQEKIKILAINDDDDDFLKRIYPITEFELTSVRSSNLNYNLIKQQQLVVLNEVKNISPNLAVELNTFTQNGGSLLIIPSLQATGYENLKSMSPQMDVNKSELKVTQIQFSHPLLQGVFNKKVSNFQYPKVNSSIGATPKTTSILNYENGTAFLYQTGMSYIFTAPLNAKNTNFKNSPLIVPVFYNIAKNSLPLPQLYYSLGTSNTIAVNTQLSADHVLSLQINDQHIIPQQRAYDNKVIISTGTSLSQPGMYAITQSNQPISAISFNVDRIENKLSYYNNNELPVEQLKTSVKDTILELNHKNDIWELWKYFLIGALIFLAIELLILKFMK